MKIGIFGGSFNPPHNFHLSIANYLVENDILDEVIFVPTGNRYPKDSLIRDMDRLEMIKLAIMGNNKLMASDYEISNRLIYTYQTLDYLKKMGDDIYFICGTDNLLEFDKWKNYEYILEYYKVIVIKRNNDNIEELLNKYDKYRKHIIACNIDSNSISSTMIRNMVKNNEDVSGYLDKKVYQYIKDRNLYQ